MASAAPNRRNPMAISSLLNPADVTSRSFHEREHRTSSQASDVPSSVAFDEKENQLPPFEIPTVPAQKQSKHSRNAIDSAQYPLLAAYISSKLVAHLKPYPASEIVPLIVQRTYQCIHNALRDLDDPTRIILSALHYLLRIFPAHIPSHTQITAGQCAAMLTRLFLSGLQLSIVWFRDGYTPMKSWTSFMRLDKGDVIMLQREALIALDHSLFITPVTWNAFMDQIQGDCGLFLQLGDARNLCSLVEELRIPVQVSPILHAPPDTKRCSNIVATDSANRRMRIAVCALTGQISSYHIRRESLRIEMGTEDDHLFDMANLQEELLLEELQENNELYPPLPESRPQSPIVPETFQETFAPPLHSTPQRSHQSPVSFVSPAVKMEGVEARLVKGPSPEEDAWSRGRKNHEHEEKAQKESIREMGALPFSTEVHPKMRRKPFGRLDRSSTESQDSRFCSRVSDSVPNTEAVAVTEGDSNCLQVEAKHILGQPFARSPSSNNTISKNLMEMTLEDGDRLHPPSASNGSSDTRVKITEFVQQCQPARLDRPLELRRIIDSPRSGGDISCQDQDANEPCSASPSPRDPPSHVGSVVESDSFCLSPLTPLPIAYMDSDPETEDMSDDDQTGYWPSGLQDQHAQEREDDANDDDDSVDSEYEYDWDTDSEDSECWNDPSVSPPPFRMPDTYNKETGQWNIDTLTEERSGEEEIFDPVAYFTSMACTNDVEDESCYSPYEAPRWQVEPGSIGRTEFAGEYREPSPHPIELEAQTMVREFAAIWFNQGHQS
ncbi:hypothetical protein FB446DRAFT_787838 [Lentinula raphanica]|nr:hypothetical protein FB446DRAFT_787838 [Lentinula raphanica]